MIRSTLKYKTSLGQRNGFFFKKKIHNKVRANKTGRITVYDFKKDNIPILFIKSCMAPKKIYQMLIKKVISDANNILRVKSKLIKNNTAITTSIETPTKNTSIKLTKP